MTVLQIFSLVMTILTFLGLSSIGPMLIKEAWEKKKAKSQEAIEQAKKQRQDETREVIKEELEPVNTRLESLETSVQKLIKADTLNERCNMKIIYDRCKAQGFADTGDKITMEQLYENYKDNGGNEFKRFVDKWYKCVKELPDADE